MRSALEERVRDRTFRVIPVLLPGADHRQRDTLPRFLRRLTWVDLRSGPKDDDAFRKFIAGIRGEFPGRRSDSHDAIRRLPPLIVHPMPPARSFVGRQKELAYVVDRWKSGWAGVLSLVGIGGAGKTAIAERFLSTVLNDDEFQPDGVFVWSFYMDPDVDAFFTEAYSYFASAPVPDESTTAVMRSLMVTLSRTGRYLLVLDGLERIQRLVTDPDGFLGQFEDPLLPQAMSRLVLPPGKSLCIITTRLPVSDLEPWLGRGYETIPVDQLELSDARDLLRNNGVEGDDSTLDHVLDEYGCHALTVDFLGRYVYEFCDGRAEEVKAIGEPSDASDIPEERRLAHVFHAYDTSLTDDELAVLSRICIFRFGTSPDILHRVFSKGSSRIASMTTIELSRIVRRLSSLNLISSDSNDNWYTVHPAVRDHFYGNFRDAERKRSHAEAFTNVLDLVGSPGADLPTDKATLDLLEELVYQAVQAGETKAAADIYESRLGGVKHLGFALGEFSRGLRILKGFPKCPNHADMAYYLFNFGELNGAKRHFPGARKIIDGILMFQALLPEAAKIGANFPTRTGVAMFLMGKTKTLPESDQYVEDLPYFPAELFLWLGDIDQAERRIQKTTALWNRQRWNDLTPRCELVKAEILGRRGMLDGAISACQVALSEISKNGTASWLCSYFMTLGRLHRYAGNFDEAESMLLEGIHLAERGGFTLYLIDLTIELSRVCLLRDQSNEAIRLSEYILNGSSDLSRGSARPLDLALDSWSMLSTNQPECAYAWGAVRAGEVLGEALLRERRNSEAGPVLSTTFRKQTQIGDSRAKLTSELLQRSKT